MTAQVILTILAILVLLFLSGFFSGSETALTAASRARMFRLKRDGKPRAGLVGRLIEDSERLIGAILLGNNLVNILASALATSLFIDFWGDAGVVYATLVMTALVLIFAEVLPKTYAITNPDRVALAVAPVIGIVVRAFAPVTGAVQGIVRLTLRLFGVDIDKSRPALSAREELRGAIDLHAREGGMIKGESDMLGSILDLDHVEVGEVMVHRCAMQSINAADPPEEILRRVVASPYTRLPLWRDNPQNIIGILHAKDVLRLVRDQPGGRMDFEKIAHEPWFVPETTSLRQQLNAFRQHHAHFALVVDEYGVILGLVTLEDILEEIVGDIVDEHDVASQGIRPQSDGRIVVDGMVTIRDLNRRFDWTLPDEEATTIAGLLINEAREIPEVGQRFSFFGFTFEVLRRVHNQITLLRLTPPASRS